MKGGRGAGKQISTGNKIKSLSFLLFTFHHIGNKTTNKGKRNLCAAHNLIAVACFVSIGFCIFSQNESDCYTTV